MPYGISMSTMSPSVIAEPFRSKEPVVSGGSTVSSVTMVETNTADTGPLRSEGVGAANGVLARFKAFVLRPGQAIELLHRPAYALTDSNDHSVGAWLTLYKEAVASKGGTRLLQELEQVGSWGRTSVAMAAKGACGNVRDWLDVSLITERMLASLAENVKKYVLRGVERSVATEFVYSIDQSVLESVAKRAAKIVVESNTTIDTAGIAKSVAKSIAKSIEKDFKEATGMALTAGGVKKLDAHDVVDCVAIRVERRIAYFVKSEQIKLRASCCLLDNASKVIERRNVEAKSPAPMPTLDQLANMKTWLGPENSHERLGKLQQGLLGISGGQTTSSSDTCSNAAQLLIRSIAGVDMGVWVEGGQAIDGWFKKASPMEKKEVAMKLNDWADQATELLLKPEVEKPPVKDLGRTASSRWFRA